MSRPFFGAWTSTFTASSCGSGVPAHRTRGVGYTLLGGRHVNDAIIAPTNNVLNALASLRYRFVEVGLEMYNVLGLKYPDDEAYFVSNWSFKPGQNPASPGVHIAPAPPRTALATLASISIWAQPPRMPERRARKSAPSATSKRGAALPIAPSRC